MKTLYLECNMGAAGDMLGAALLGLLPESDQTKMLNTINGLGLPGVSVSSENVTKHDISGLHLHVLCNGEEEKAASCLENEEAHPASELKHSHESGHAPAHHHTTLEDVRNIVATLPISDKARADILAVYNLIAEAESHAHGQPITQIHFHEVGTLDAIADVATTCLIMEKLAPQQVAVSPIHVGCGHIHCAHGILPVPTPAAAYLLRGLPIYGGQIRGELCTPTGAALLKYFATYFGPMPNMEPQKVSYGFGSKEFTVPNCVKAIFGNTTEDNENKTGQTTPAVFFSKNATSIPLKNGHQDFEAEPVDYVYELKCNIDDMTGEELGFAMESLMERGALDVFMTNIIMKKSRPAVLLTVLCHEDSKQELIRAIFCHTTTLGVRETFCKRYVLRRESSSLDTAYGRLQRKQAAGYGVTRSKYEHEELARTAVQQNMSLMQLKELLP